jgi:hypothetical protein
MRQVLTWQAEQAARRQPPAILPPKILLSLLSIFQRVLWFRFTLQFGYFFAQLLTFPHFNLQKSHRHARFLLNPKRGKQVSVAGLLLLFRKFFILISPFSNSALMQ